MGSKSEISYVEDISYKLDKTEYIRGIGAKYDRVVPAKDMKIKIVRIPLKEANSEARELFNHRFVRLNFKVGYRSSEIDDKCNRGEFGILIRIDIENEGIESESLRERALGLSKYAWNFHTCLWGEYENAYPHRGRDVNSSEEIQVMLIVPDKLYKSFGQINALPGPYSIHIVKSKDVDSLALDPPGDTSKIKERISELDILEDWYKVGSLMINWEFRKTQHVSREVVVEHIESFPRLPMVFLLFSLLSVISFFNFLNDLCVSIPLEMSCVRFKFLWTFMIAFLILTVYIFINLYNYAFHEIKIHYETAHYIHDFNLSIIVSIPSLIPFATVISFDWIDIIRVKIGGPLLIVGCAAFILVCFYVLAFRKITQKEETKPRRRYILDSLPILGSLLIALFALFLVSSFNIQNIFLLWAYLSSISTLAVLKVSIGV